MLSKSVKKNIHLSKFFYLTVIFIYPLISNADHEEDVHSESIGYDTQETNESATIIIDELRRLNTGFARQINTEIRYGFPESPYHQLNLVRGGSIGNTHIIKAPIGTRIVVSYSPYVALRCLYFDIADLGVSTLTFNHNFDFYTTFRISNTRTLKPVFKSDFDHIISDNYYHCPWPEPKPEQY